MSNVSPSVPKSIQRLRLGLAIGFILLFFSSCGYWVGRPWTCAQAKDMLEAEKANAPRFDSDIAASITRSQKHIYDVQDAQENVDKRCR